jgi:hypothetical protein
MYECKKKAIEPRPDHQYTRPEFVSGHVYKVRGTMYSGLNCFYLATKNAKEEALHSLGDGNRWSTHEDGPFGNNASITQIWTDVTSKVCIDTGGA